MNEIVNRGDEHLLPSPAALGFWIQWAARSHSVDFEVCRIAGIQPDGRLLCGEQGETLIDVRELPPISEKGEGAGTFLSGFIKWDGCSNWNWHTSPVMQHFCSKEDALELGSVMARLFAIAEQQIPVDW